MTRSRRTSIVLPILAIFMLGCSTAKFISRKSSLKGRITAYRPADRMLQVASFVDNREILLFHVEGNSGVLVKLVYIHQGYSDIKDDVLSGATEIAIVAHRDLSCDESFDKFEKEAIAIPAEGGVRAVGEKIIFTDDKSRQLPKSYHLKCYILDQWEPIRSGK